MFCGFLLYSHSELLGQFDRMLQHNPALIDQYSIQIEKQCAVSENIHKGLEFPGGGVSVAPAKKFKEMYEA